MQAEHIRLDAKQIVATALSQGMINQAQADIVMGHAAEYEKRGSEHVDICALMVSLNLLTTAQAQTVEQLVHQTVQQQTFTIGKYLLTNRLGAGAMGTVYLATDQTLQRKVAIKILLPQLAAHPEFVARFKREARMTAQLSHRNIVHIHDIDEIDGFLFYAMEYLEGQGLDDVLKKKGKLPPNEALGYIIQAARGLEAAHKANIIHRDVKPANLFLTKEGSIKLVDLGLSKDASDHKASEASMTGMAIGTPHYIAPEQARGLEGIDGRADIYGLGCTLYSLITGTTPYSGPNPLAIMNKQINDPPPDPRSVVPGLPAHFTVLIELMMAKNPNDRYQSCTELIADLERVLAGKAPMGASVAVADDEGGGDVPALKRRPVGGKRGSSGPITSVRGARPASALLLESPRGDSSALRRASSITAQRRQTGVIRGSGGDLREDDEAPEEDAETPVEEWKRKALELWRKYPVQLGVAGGVLGLILLIAFISMLLPGPVPKYTPKPTTADARPNPRPVTPNPGISTVPAAGGTTPPPNTTPSPAPHELSPYEMYHQSPPKPTTPPSPTPTPVPPGPAATRPGGKPASYTPPPAGCTPVLYLDGTTADGPVGRWHRTSVEREAGGSFVHFIGAQQGAPTDIQWPYFEFNQPFKMEGNCLLRCRMRRNGKNSKSMRVSFYTGAATSERCASFDLGPAGKADTWLTFEAQATVAAGSPASQFEVRSNGDGSMGETVDVEWLELCTRVGGGTGPAQSLAHVASGKEVLILQCESMTEREVEWKRCTAEKENATTYVHWTFSNHTEAGGGVMSPSFMMKNGFSWVDTRKFTVKMRIRAKGTPRFNCGLKFYYGNERNPNLTATSRIDFDRDTWGDWQNKTVTIDVGLASRFKELEIRPYEENCPDGSIDIDWIEIIPEP